MGKGAALVLHGPRAGAGAKEVVGAAQEAAAMARGEGGEWDSQNGWALVNGAMPPYVDDTAGCQRAELGRASILGSAARPRHKLGLNPGSARWSGLSSARMRKEA